MAGTFSGTHRFSIVIRSIVLPAAIGVLVGCQSDAPTATPIIGEVSLAKGGGSGGGAAPTVTSTNPSFTLQDTTIDVSIFGTGFTTGAKATWSLNGDTTNVHVKSTKVVNSTQVIARIQVPATAPVASYDVEITLLGGKKGVGAEMFSVQARPLYRLRLISGVTATGDGEITSDWFPATGFRVTVNNPWVNLPGGQVTIQLTNFTHGDMSAGRCAEFIQNYTLPLNLINWDVIGTNPTRTYAGTWRGNVTVSRGYLAFDGDRVVNGVLTPSAGGIHNVVTQDNVMIETVGPNFDWFRQEVRGAGFKFGGASTPDGANLVASELACINYTVEMRKTTLIP